MYLNTNESRRRFLKIGASMILASTSSSASAKVIFKRKSPASKELLEAGLILGAYSHSNGIWGNYLNPPGGEVRRTGMVYTKVWSADPKIAESFREKYGGDIVKRFDSMVGKVHGMIVDDFYAVAYNYKLARPYLEAGIPTFVNRPYADSMMKARDMTNRAKKGGAPLMTGSSWEHLKEVHTVRQKVNINEVTGYEAWNSCSDYYSHGLHGVWWAYATAGGGIQAVSMKSKNWRTCANPHDPEKSSITYVLYKDRGKGPFIGKINEGQMPGIGSNNCAITFQPGNRTHIHHAVDPWGRAEFVWLPMLHRIQWMFETGNLFQKHDEILEKTAMFIAAFRSHLEMKGQMVGLDTLPEEWAIGSPYLNGASKEGIEPYIKLFGKEKGAIKPL